MAAKIRKGYKVIVLTGRDKGRSGEVIEVRPDEERALVRRARIAELPEIDLICSFQLAHGGQDRGAQVGPVGASLRQIGPPVLGAQVVKSVERIRNLSQHHQGPRPGQSAVSCGKRLVAVVQARRGRTEELKRVACPPLVTAQ